VSPVRIPHQRRKNSYRNIEVEDATSNTLASLMLGWIVAKTSANMFCFESQMLKIDFSSYLS
jgi:hypothetical protein